MKKLEQRQQTPQMKFRFVKAQPIQIGKALILPRLRRQLNQRAMRHVPNARI